MKKLVSFFDPLGYLQPIVLHYNLLFQKLCKVKLNWDTEIPSDFIKEWNDLLKILNDLDSIEVNLNVFVKYENDPIFKRELHGFSNASLLSYGATIYVKTFLESGKVHTNFFTAKSRITSLKKITIPSLELLRNLILARLMNSVKITIEKDAQIDNIYCWTDSKVCLSWIDFEKSFNVFVENRVQEIKRLSNKLSWWYCESENNPIDFLTKMGFPLSQLKEKKYGGRDLTFSRNKILK